MLSCIHVLPVFTPLFPLSLFSVWPLTPLFFYFPTPAHFSSSFANPCHLVFFHPTSLFVSALPLSWQGLPGRCTLSVSSGCWGERERNHLQRKSRNTRPGAAVSEGTDSCPQPQLSVRWGPILNLRLDWQIELQDTLFAWLFQRMLKQHMQSVSLTGLIPPSFCV